MPKLLTKSKYLAGLQCPLLLWYHFNRPELIPKPDEAKQAIFDQGHLVGDYAKKLFPSGEEVEYKKSFPDRIKKTDLLIKNRKIIFEALITKDNLYSQPDILVPVNHDQWDIIEVKSSTSVKDINIEDVAFQKYLYELYGLKIRKCLMLVINNEYVRKEDIEPKRLFKKADITEDVNNIIDTIPDKIKTMFDIIKLKKPQEVKIGPWCNDPYDCLLKELCWKHLPDNNVTELYRISNKSFDLIDNNIIEIKDIPDEYKLTDNQRKQLFAIKNNQPYINKNKIKQFIDKLEYPLYFLDFESINPAIPLFQDTRPYQHIVFQYSLHVKETKDSKLKHHGFIAKHDPRLTILKHMLPKLGKRGSIIVYNQSFEKQRLLDLAQWYPEYSKHIENILKRIVDLIIPFRKFYYYDKKQQGSCSIKAVLPVLTDLSYKDMDIPDGGQAQREYLRVTQTKVTKKEQEKVFKQLDKYCELDTYAMVEILDKLTEIIS